MPITRYRPSTEPINALLDDMLVPFARMGSSMRMPETDVIERQNEIRVVCELPGMGQDQVELSMENNVLTISGEKNDQRESNAEGDTYHLSERRWGRFSRSFVLPREVDQERISAEFDNGVLTVTVPKSERARRRRIEISNRAPGSTTGHNS